MSLMASLDRRLRVHLKCGWLFNAEISIVEKKYNYYKHLVTAFEYAASTSSSLPVSSSDLWMLKVARTEAAVNQTCDPLSTLFSY